jgi:hypothetical protein
MAFVDDEDVGPDELIKLGRCPECGKLLSLINGAAHANEHWPNPGPPDTRHEEARRRRKLLLDALAEREKEVQK